MKQTNTTHIYQTEIALNKNTLINVFFVKQNYAILYYW